MLLNKKNFLFKKKRLITYNQTFSYISETCFPKNILELKKILKNEFKNKNFLLKTGLCGHGDKSSLSKSNFVLSLKMMNKMSRINKKKNIIIVQAGAMLFDLTVYLKKNGYLYVSATPDFSSIGASMYKSHWNQTACPQHIHQFLWS